ncbi:MAG: ATP-NAD kinase [Acidimicrobiales bacterium]|nr:ATP-NAD kinase [Acidimicrobiales bacterium]
MENRCTVGIIANPASARDIRRIVAHGGSTTTHDKLNTLQRVLAGLASVGIERVISMADRGGISAGLVHLAGRTSAAGWPAIELIDQEITQTATDTTAATKAMVDAGVGAIVVLGGDGTNGVVARSSDDVPLVSISTGTNNAFPRPVEPTVAGLAAGLVATNTSSHRVGTYRAKKLVVRCGDFIEEALVDVAIAAVAGVGAGAVWDGESVSEVYLCFAESDVIGLSAIGGHIRPTSRRSPTGLALVLDSDADTVVRAPIAPGLFPKIGVVSARSIEPCVRLDILSGSGVIAVDGERRFRFGPQSRPHVTLSPLGPVVVDVRATLEHAALSGLLARTTPAASRLATAHPDNTYFSASTTEPTEVTT